MISSVSRKESVVWHFSFCPEISESWDSSHLILLGTFLQKFRRMVNFKFNLAYPWDQKGYKVSRLLKDGSCSHKIIAFQESSSLTYLKYTVLSWECLCVSGIINLMILFDTSQCVVCLCLCGFFPSTWICSPEFNKIPAQCKWDCWPCLTLQDLYEK